MITKNTTIGEVVQMYPQAAVVMQNAGLSCAGCGVAYWETIEEGAKGHGFDDEMIEGLIAEINKVAADSMAEEKHDDLSVSSKAIERIKDLGGALRIRVVDGGCSGKSYQFSIGRGEDDHKISLGGVDIMIDKGSFDMIKGSRLDYIDALQGAGFKIDNPNAKRKCGCGTSFS